MKEHIIVIFILIAEKIVKSILKIDRNIDHYFIIFIYTKSEQSKQH